MTDEQTPAQFWWRQLRIPLIVFIVAAITFDLTSFDRDIAHALFYLDHRWIGARALLTDRIIHNGGQWIVRLLGLALLILWIATFYKKQWRELRRPSAYAFLALLLSIGIVGLLKTVTNIHCPRELSEFGGTLPYVRLTDQRPASARHGQCFPAAHASAGYALMAFWFVFRERDRRLARRGLVTGVIVGLIFGFAQQSRGAHFVSHDIWSAFLVWLICLTLYTAAFGARLWPPSTMSR